MYPKSHICRISTLKFNFFVPDSCILDATKKYEREVNEKENGM